MERGLDQLLVVLADVRADRPPSLRRRLDHADVAQARERHVQRARDRRRRQREHVHLEAQLAQELLLRDAEALLLVDDHEAEILGDHVAREHAVRADRGRRPSPRRSRPGSALTSAGLRKRETISTVTGRSRQRSRNVFQCCWARIVVGARTSVCLLADGDGEGGADRDLGLAEADVAADEPVHRARRLEVLLDRLDRALLVGRLLVREARLELLERGRRRPRTRRRSPAGASA